MSDLARPPSSLPAPPATLVQAITTLSPCVVVLFGTPGSGKSTLAAALAEQVGDGAWVLSYAAHRAEVSGDPADPAADPQAGTLLQARLADRCAAGLTTIVDGTHHLPRSRAAVLAIATGAGLPALAVVLSTPLEVCLARQGDRPPPEPGVRHGLRVPDPQVREIHRALQGLRGDLTGEGFLVYVLAPDATIRAG